MKAKERVLKEATTIYIENLPPNYNHLMLSELLKNYPGVLDTKINSDR